MQKSLIQYKTLLHGLTQEIFGKHNQYIYKIAFFKCNSSL